MISAGEGRAFDSAAWPPRPSGVTFAHPGWLEEGLGFGSLAYSRDGRLLATAVGLPGYDRRCWRLPRPHSRPPLPLAESARLSLSSERRWDRTVLIDPRGAKALLGGYDGSVRIVDLADGGVRLTAIRHTQKIRDVALHPGGRLFAAASDDATARVWEVDSGRPAGPPLPGAVMDAAVAFSPDGRTLAVGDYGGQVQLWDWRAGSPARRAFVHDDIILRVAFSPDGRYLAAIKTKDWSGKPELVLWDVASGTAVLRVPTDAAYGEMVVFRPDGRALVVATKTEGLLLREVPTGRVLGRRPIEGPGAARFSPDGRVVAAAERRGVRLLDAETLRPLPGGYLPAPVPVPSLAFSPDGSLLLTGRTEGSAQLWDLATRKPVGPPAVLIGPIRAVAFTPDGRTCLGVTRDGTARRWTVPAPITEPDLDRLADRVALMLGQRMGNDEGLDSLPADEWRALRARMVGDGSTALVPPRPDAEWHEARAADAEQDRDGVGALWHLDRLAALRPGDWTVAARRGRAHAAAGRRDEAAAAYELASRLAPAPRAVADWLRVVAGDEEAAGRKEAALWNLDRAVATAPEDWTLYALRAGLAGPAGRPPTRMPPPAAGPTRNSSCGPPPARPTPATGRGAPGSSPTSPATRPPRPSNAISRRSRA